MKRNVIVFQGSILIEIQFIHGSDFVYLASLKSNSNSYFLQQVYLRENITYPEN